MHEDPFKCAGAARGCGCVNAEGGSWCFVLLLSLRPSRNQWSSLPGPPVSLWRQVGLNRPMAPRRESKIRGCQSQLPSFSQPNKQSPVTSAISKPDLQHSRTQLPSCSTQFLVFSIPRLALFVPHLDQNVYPSLLRHLQVGQRRELDCSTSFPGFRPPAFDEGVSWWRVNSRKTFLLTLPFPF